MEKEVYLDNAATTKPYKEAIDEMSRVAMDCYGNPSSLHHLGFVAETEMKRCLDIIANSLKVKRDEIIITSGATEGNNLAIIGSAYRNKRKGMHLITSKGEHPAVIEVFKYLEKQGFEVTYLDLNKYGQIEIDNLKQALRNDTIFVSIMHVNNEIGTVQDLSKICEIVKAYNEDIVIHSDCTQSYGKYRIYPKKLKLDLITTSAHKFHGPRGVGFLYKNEKVRVSPVLFGGGQQGNLRSGTENLPGLAAMAKACEISYKDLENKSQKMLDIKKIFINGLKKIDASENAIYISNDQDVIKNINQDVESYNCLSLDESKISPSIISVTFLGIRSEVFLHSLEEKGIYVSSGSACATNHPGISSVLEAIGLEKKGLDSTIRFSFNEYIQNEEVIYTLKVINELLPMLKRYVRH